MGLNIFDWISAFIGVLGAIGPLVQVPLSIQAEKRRAQPVQQNLHMVHRGTRHYKR